MEIIKGKLQSPQKVVMYGPEGIGKSGFGAQAPNPLIIDIEGSTAHLDVARTPRPTSWTHLLSIINDITRDPMGFKTVVVDTGDWAERLAIAQICAQFNMSSLGGNDDWGKSYNLLRGEYGTFLDSLTRLSEATGMHVIVLCHAMRRREQQPEEFGAYDSWCLALEKKPAKLLMEWADMVLFANYKTMVVEDSKTKTKKGTGGSRVIYTTHHPCWDAKNRHDLPDEMPFPKDAGFQQIAHCFGDVAAKPIAPPAPAPAPTPAPGPASTPKPTAANGALGKLRDMMKADGITDRQVQGAIAARGFFPADTPLTQLPADFIEGCLLPGWGKVKAMIQNGETANV